MPRHLVEESKLFIPDHLASPPYVLLKPTTCQKPPRKYWLNIGKWLPSSLVVIKEIGRLKTSSWIRSCLWGVTGLTCGVYLAATLLKSFTNPADHFVIENQRFISSAPRVGELSLSDDLGINFSADDEDDVELFVILKESIQRLKALNKNIKLHNEQLTAENSDLKENNEALEKSVFDLQHQNADLFMRKIELEKAKGWLEAKLQNTTQAESPSGYSFSGLVPPSLNKLVFGESTGKFGSYSPVIVERLDLKTFQSTQFHWPAYEERNGQWCAAFNKEPPSKEDGLKHGQIQPVPWLEFPNVVRDEYNQFTIEPHKDLIVRYRTRLYRITPRYPTWKDGEGADCQITLASIGSLDRLPTLAETTRVWRGRVSLAIWVSSKQKITEDWILSLLGETFAMNEASTVVVFIIAAIPGRDADVFPINVLRNYARFGVEAKYLYQIDGDEVPNASCRLHDAWLQAGVEKDAIKGGRCGLTAWVTASLELTEPFRRNVTTKEYLRSLTKRPDLENHITKELAVEWLEDFHLQTFHMNIWNSYGPQLTYSMWKSAVEPYGVSWHYLAEPYTIAEVPTPWCPTPFYNYGDSADKVACSILLYASGYKLAVLPQAFTIDDLFVDIETVETTKEGRRTRQFCWSPNGRNGENKDSWCRARRDFLFDILWRNMGVPKQSSRKYSRALEIKEYNEIIKKSQYKVDMLPFERNFLK